MNASQFDPSAFNGGGFMQQSSTQTTDYGSSSSNKNQETKSILPLTIKQISDSYSNSEDKGNFVVDGVELNTISLLGMVVDMVSRVTEVTFTLDDGTGQIKCHRWCNETSETQEMESITNGMYVVLHGNLKGFQAKKEMMAFSVRPVTDFNQVAYHFIECMYVHCRNTKSQIKGESGNSTQPQSALSYQTAPSNQVPLQSSLGGLNAQVLDFLSQPAHMALEQGLSLQQLAKYFRVSEPKIRETIKLLEEEGVVYSTIDEDHYKSSHNG